MKTAENKQIVDSLENFTTGTFKGKSGNTTRLVDHIIQLLFQGNRVIVKDHCEGGMNYHYNLELFRKVVNRLRLEHLQLFMEHKIIGSEKDKTFEIEILD